MTLTKGIVAAALLPILVGQLSGCANSSNALFLIHDGPLLDKDALKTVQVFRGRVVMHEKESHLFSKPAFYTYNRHGWGANANQYRGVLIDGYTTYNGYPPEHYGFRARVPDHLPLLGPHDLVDIYWPNFPDTDWINENELNAPIISRIACRASDRECIQASRKKLGGDGEPVPGEKADLSGFTFTKTYDLSGDRLQK